MIIYTDGATAVNPGPSGWAYVILMDAKSDKIICAAGGLPHSTSNRMELTAVLNALKYADEIEYRGPIQIYTDSQYVSRAFNEGWLERWIEQNFKNIKNKDLWLQLYRYFCKLEVMITWVKGHTGIFYNELANKLAQEAKMYQGIPNIYPIPLINVNN
jgi:ribonuclease HI